MYIYFMRRRSSLPTCNMNFRLNYSVNSTIPIVYVFWCLVFGANRMRWQMNEMTNVLLDFGLCNFEDCHYKLCMFLGGINWLQNGGLFENYTGIHTRDLGH